MSPKLYACEMIKEDQETKYMILSFKTNKERDNWINEKNTRFLSEAKSPLSYIIKKYNLEDYSIIPRSMLSDKDRK